MDKGYYAYKSINVDTADQGKLILITYDVAIKHCRIALEKFSNQSLIEERTKDIFKVQDAVSELMSSLNLDVGEIAQNLYKLYDYMIRRLVNANTKGESQPVREVLGYLIDLKSAWQETIIKIKSENSVSENITKSDGIALTG